MVGAPINNNDLQLSLPSSNDDYAGANHAIHAITNVKGSDRAGEEDGGEFDDEEDEESVYGPD